MKKIFVSNITIYSTSKLIYRVLNTLVNTYGFVLSLFGKNVIISTPYNFFENNIDNNMDFFRLINQNDQLAYKIAKECIIEVKHDDRFSFQGVDITLLGFWHLYYRFKELINNKSYIETEIKKLNQSKSAILLTHPLIADVLEIPKVSKSKFISQLYNFNEYIYRLLKNLKFFISSLIQTPICPVYLTENIDFLFISAGTTSIEQFKNIQNKIRNTNKFVEINTNQISSYYHLLSFREKCQTLYSVHKYRNLIKKKSVKFESEIAPFSINRSVKDFYSQKMAYELFMDILIIKKLLDKLNPKVLLVQFDSNIIENTFVQLCKLKSIKTCSFQDGFVFNEFGAFHVFSEYIITSGETISKIYQKGGHPKNKIIALGRPIYDPYLNQITKSTKTLRSNKHKFNIVFAPDPGGGSISLDYLDLLHCKILEIFEYFSEYSFTIKLHTQDHSNIWKTQISTPNIIIEQNKNAYQLMLEADVWISMSSTTSLEAFLFDCDSIVFDPYNTANLNYAIDSGIIRRASSLIELSTILNTLNEVRRPYDIKEKVKYLSNFPNESSPNILKFLYSFL